MNQLTKIFISHATPEDNYFASWLSIKLKLLNYDVWCEVDDLKGGEDFWKEIEKTIRQETVKFISVVSNNSISPNKRGFRQELKAADNIRDRGDFIIPIKIDNVSPDALPMELGRLNVLDFSENWAIGLGKLVDKLVKDQVPQLDEVTNSEDIFGFWRRGIDLQDTTLVKRDELYRTNWFPIELPPYIYLHIFQNAHRSDRDTMPYPIVQQSDYFLTFADLNSFQAPIADSERLQIGEFRKFPQQRLKTPKLGKIIEHPNHILIDLLNQALPNYMQSKGLQAYSLSNRDIHFFPNPNTKINMKKHRRNPISLTGTKLSWRWHFALGAKAFLYPQPAYSISTHIVFTENNGRPVDKAMQHSLRRDMGKNWWNKEWRDHLLGAVLWLAEGDEADRFSMPVGNHSSLLMNTQPIHLISSTGFIEPGEKKSEKIVETEE